MRRIIAALALVCSSAAAQDYPSRPVHLVVPYTPGTGADILARLVGARLSERWQTAVITDNRPGATGNIGAEQVAKSPPDGYAVLFAATSFATNIALTRVPYDPVKSFAPVALVATSSLAVVVNPDLPVRSMRDFVAYAKTQPGKLYYGSPGNGGVQHLAMELLKLETGMNLVHVPYKGLGGAMSDVIGGHVAAMVSATQSAAPHVHSGKLRMLAVMSGERLQTFPDVPTLKELNLGDLEIYTWYAAFVPAGTPAAVIQKLNSSLNEALNDAQVRKNLDAQGLIPAGGDPARLEQLLKKELARWPRVVSASGIKAD